MTEERAESRTGTKTGVRLRKLLTGQKRYPVVFAGLILLYLILLFVVSCIPNEWLSGNYEESMKEFTKGMYWSVDDSLVGTQMDGGTDQLILSNCVTDESHSAFYNMLDVKDYARYWHGYLVPVRPLLCLMTYKHIKYISMILCFVLLCLVYEKVGKAINRGVGMALIVSLCMGNIIVIPLSFQYMSMYYITTVAVLLYCLAAKRGRPDAGLFFLAVGSVTNFIDFLTSPLNSLGMLLVVAYLLYVKQAPEERGLKRILFLLKNSVAWVCGYGFTWLAKWCIASVFLRRNVILDALDTILFRTAGNEEYPTDRLGTIRVNLGYMLPKGAVAVLGALVICWAAVLLFAWVRDRRRQGTRKCLEENEKGAGREDAASKRIPRRYPPETGRELWRREDKNTIVESLPVLLVAAYPFIWYLVLSNHSQIHSYFTYRTLETSVFAVLSFMAVCARKRKGAALAA